MDSSSAKHMQMIMNNSSPTTSNSLAMESAGLTRPEMGADVIQKNENLSVRVAKSGKKRSRPSKRPQTTLVRTDPSNFRAMVQKFTGLSRPPMPMQIPMGTPSTSAPSLFPYNGNNNTHLTSNIHGVSSSSSSSGMVSMAPTQAYIEALQAALQLRSQPPYNNHPPLHIFNNEGVGMFSGL